MLAGQTWQSNFGCLSALLSTPVYVVKPVFYVRCNELGVFLVTLSAFRMLWSETLSPCVFRLHLIAQAHKIWAGESLASVRTILEEVTEALLRGPHVSTQYREIRVLSPRLLQERHKITTYMKAATTELFSAVDYAGDVSSMCIIGGGMSRATSRGFLAWGGRNLGLRHDSEHGGVGLEAN